MDWSQKRKTTEDLILDFCQELQKADLGLDKLIKDGYVVYGQTRSGKTASCHLLSENTLKGVKIGDQDKVQNATTKYKNAKIGNTSQMIRIKYDKSNMYQKVYYFVIFYKQNQYMNILS